MLFSYYFLFIAQHLSMQAFGLFVFALIGKHSPHIVKGYQRIKMLIP